MKFSYSFVICVIALLSHLGCSRELSRIEPPKYNPNAGEQAISLYDTNKDNAISGTELDAVGALKASLEQVDSNNDGSLTAQEINGRVKQWLDLRIGEMPLQCEVYLDDQPLANAQIILEPEPFLGAAVKKASGITMETGSAGISMATADLADARYGGLACGWYKIRVTSTEKTLPARYNTETTLGCEVAINAAWFNHGAVEIRMKSQ